ncbi:MAG: hypothetical protein ACYDDU_16305 [Dermatophilaceae bacterium]
MNFLTTQQLDRKFSDGTTPRERYIAGRPVTEVPDFMSNSLGAHVAIITADHHIVFSQRSSNVAVQASMWSSSIGEGLSRELDNEGQGQPNLYSVARRGIREELGLDPSDYDLELMAFGLETTVHQWVGLFAATLKTIKWEELCERLGRGVQDSMEHSNHEAVVFNPREALKYLLREDRIDNWSPMTPALCYYALCRRFGKRYVERELAHLKRSKAKS